MKTACVSIDLDEVHHYRAIHGLPERASRAVYEHGLPRALAWAERHRLSLTLFVVSDDLADARNAAALRDAVTRGHDVESHSASHPYDLVRRSRDDLRREVSGSFDTIERVLGRRPTGFRAPGYTMSDELLDAVEEAGATYDASLLPSPPYYAAKLAALGAIAATGRRSSSIVGDPRAVFGPTEPYRPGRPYWKPGTRRLVEIPMRVTPGARLPVIGTSLGRFGPRVARSLVRACSTERTFSLELHGMDFLERDDGLQDLAGHVSELARPLDHRIACLDVAIEALHERHFALTTLAGVAAGIG